MMETGGCWARPMPWAGGTGRVAVSTLFTGIKVESMDYFLNKQECTCVFYSHQMLTAISGQSQCHFKAPREVGGKKKRDGLLISKEFSWL